MGGKVILSPFHNTYRFDFSRYIPFTMHTYIYICVYIHNKRNVFRKKQNDKYYETEGVANVLTQLSSSM